MYRLLEADPNFTLSDFGTYHLATNNPYHNRKLGLLPRYHGKSRVGTVAYCMWRLFKDPNLRILIMSEIWDNARDMLRMIKDLYKEIENTKDSELAYVHMIMGDWRGDLWNEDKIIVKQRVRKGTDPSIATAGMEREVTSKHFDIIILDDLLGESNTKTKDQLKKSIKHFSSLTEIGDVDQDKVSLYVVWGTTWDYNDLYATICNKMKEQFDILKLRCWDDESCKDPTQTLFPAKFPLEYLKNVYRDKLTIGDPDSFYKQYLNDPLPEQAQVFKSEFIQYYDPKDIEHKKLTVVITVDPALSENEWSDNTAIVAVGLDSGGRRYVLDYVKFKQSDPAEVVKQLIMMAKRYWQRPTHNLLVVGIERGSLKNTLEPHILKFAPWMPYTGLDHMNQNKTHRIINSLQPFVITRRIFLQRWMHDLIDQMIRFPKANIERDVLDALAYHVQLVPVWENQNIQLPEPQSVDREFWSRVAGSRKE